MDPALENSRIFVYSNIAILTVPWVMSLAISWGTSLRRAVFGIKDLLLCMQDEPKKQKPKPQKKEKKVKSETTVDNPPEITEVSI